MNMQPVYNNEVYHYISIHLEAKLPRLCYVIYL